jgi:hypothetical protein
MRIQILPLPSVVKGDDVEEPFAIVVDQFEHPIDESATARWQQFKEQCGARAVLVDPGTVEVVDRYAAPAPSAAEIEEQRRKAMEDRAKYEAALKQHQDEQLRNRGQRDV